MRLLKNLSLAPLLALALTVLAAPAHAQEGTERYSNDETRRLYEQWQQSGAQIDRLEAEQEACTSNPDCPFARVNEINAEQSQLTDEAERTVEDLVQTKLDLIREAPASEQKLDALQALESFSDDELGGWVASDTTQAVREERKAAEAQLAAAQEEAPEEADPAEPAAGGGEEAPSGSTGDDGETAFATVVNAFFAVVFGFLELALRLLFFAGILAIGFYALKTVVVGRASGGLLRWGGGRLRGYLLRRIGGQPGPAPSRPAGPRPRPAGDPPQGDGWMFGGHGGRAKRSAPAGGSPRETEEQKRARLLNLETTLHEQIVGQEEAVSAVASSVRRREAGGFGGERPASFLFMGPTGVGKTEVAKVVADQVYGGEMVRLDMSEYGSEGQVARMVGAPPGYVGHEAGGQLTDPILENPRQVVLLDEIEKAHERAWTILLGVLDDGRLTDNRGRTADFGQATVVMTSNLLAEEIRQVYESGGELDERAVKNELVRRGIKRELVNRIGRIVIFRPLSQDDVREICRRMLKKTVRQMAEKHAVEVRFTDAAVGLLSDWGYEVENGSRPLRGVIESEVEDRLSDLLLRGKIGKGSAVEFDLRALEDGAHVLGVRPAQRSAAGDGKE